MQKKIKFVFLFFLLESTFSCRHKGKGPNKLPAPRQKTTEKKLYLALPDELLLSIKETKEKDVTTPIKPEENKLFFAIKIKKSSKYYQKLKKHLSQDHLILTSTKESVLIDQISTRPKFQLTAPSFLKNIFYKKLGLNGFQLKQTYKQQDAAQIAQKLSGKGLEITDPTKASHTQKEKGDYLSSQAKKDWGRNFQNMSVFKVNDQPIKTGEIQSAQQVIALIQTKMKDAPADTEENLKKLIETSAQTNEVLPFIFIMNNIVRNPEQLPVQITSDLPGSLEIKGNTATITMTRRWGFQNSDQNASILPVESFRYQRQITMDLRTGQMGEETVTFTTKSNLKVTSEIDVIDWKMVGLSLTAAASLSLAAYFSSGLLEKETARDLAEEAAEEADIKNENEKEKKTRTIEVKKARLKLSESKKLLIFSASQKKILKGYQVLLKKGQYPVYLFELR